MINRKAYRQFLFAQRHRILVGFYAFWVAGSACASALDTIAGSQLAALDQTTAAVKKDVQVPSLASALGEQRYRYNLAKSALSTNKMDTYNRNYELLGDYPLVPYLDYTALRSQSLTSEAVDEFLDKYADSFLAVRLRQTWLTQLAARKQWQEYIDYYRPEVADTALECHYLYARVHGGDTQALEQTTSIWNVGKSQPTACDALFARWQKAGYRTQEVTWSRLDKAMQARQLGLARYLAAKLGGEHQKLAQLYLRVDQHPSLIKQRQLFRPQRPEIQQIIAHGVERMARTRAKEALAQWEAYEAQQLFSKEVSHAAKVTLVRYLTRQGSQADAEQLLQSSSSLRQTDIVEELVREALRDMDWQAVERRILMLPENQQATDRWRYWRARAVGELGLADADFPIPTEVYEALAGERSFYGFLAADILDRDYELKDMPLEVQPAVMEAVRTMPGMRRAKELWLTGSHAEAKAEWLHTIRHMAQQELIAAGELARQWGWHNKGIHAMIAGNLWDHLAIRFPLAYQEEVTRIANDIQLDPTFIYAIARQESAFAENARSSAGARGLMQLMPATAAQTARTNGLKHSLRDLYNPEHNILLGSSYMSSLLQRFNNNRILAAAAYNAGPHRVDRWISKPDKERPFDVWIETIPFHETRGYVQNVLSFSVIYGYRMGQATHLVTAKEAKDLL